MASHYDLKHIFRLILNSKTYQLSPIPRGSRPEAAAHFACYPLRRLDAEVLIDAIYQITGTSEAYTSAIPEPYTFMPDFQRAISLPDGSISSAFLELVRTPGARYRPGIGTQQPPHRRAAAAHAEFQPRAAQDPAGAQAGA